MTSDPHDQGSPTSALRRTVRLPGLVLYGMGTTIGAGVYALTGVISAEAGMQMPLAFAVACFLAALTAGSFAELSSRFPRAGGEAVYVREGMGSESLSRWVGIAVAAAGSVSAATVAVAFAETLSEFISLPVIPVVLGVTLVVGCVAAYGIKESVVAAAVMTLLEISGLLLVVGYAGESFASLPERIGEFWPDSLTGWSGVGSAAMLAFYAFLGFEDMVNIAEEVEDPSRTLPLAIGVTLVATTLLYMLTAAASVLSVSPGELAASDAPLILVFESCGGAPIVLGWIALLAMLNGALVQVVKSARVLYGLADLGTLPKALAAVHPTRKTPVRSTVLVTFATAALAGFFPLETLAAATSLITLCTFSLTNLSLVLIQRRDPDSPKRLVPRWLPVAGFVLTLGFVGVEAARRLLSSPGLLP